MDNVTAGTQGFYNMNHEPPDSANHFYSVIYHSSRPAAFFVCLSLLLHTLSL